MIYPTFLSEEAADLLKHLLVRKPGDRYSCHEALRHPFFKKYGLDIEKEEEENLEKAREDSVRNLNQTISSAERKLKPKVLTESMAFAPSLSEMQEEIFKVDEKGKDSSTSNIRKQSQEQKIDDTLELSQSVFLSPSQLQETLVAVVKTDQGR